MTFFLGLEVKVEVEIPFGVNSSDFKSFLSKKMQFKELFFAEYCFVYEFDNDKISF